MKVIYKSDDGIEFEDKASCAAYESGSKPLMWDCLGEPTTNPADAKFVYCKDENASKTFIQLCKNENSPDAICDGVEEDAYGFFAWSEYDNTYTWINPDDILTCWKLMNEACPELLKEN